MRNSWAGAAAAAILVLGTGSALAQSDASHFAATDGDVPVVGLGDEIAIACDALASPNADVRVVLTVSAAPTDTPVGYKNVLATDEQMLMGAVRVKIPEMPDLENRTVDLHIYVVNAEGSQACNAGQVKIADGLKKPAPAPANDSKS